MNEHAFTPWPEPLARHYKTAGYWADRTLYSAFSHIAQQNPERLAVSDTHTRLTYSELQTRSLALANALHKNGIRSGERAIVHLPNTVAFVVTTLACLRLGIQPIMALPAHRQHEIGYLLEFSRARAYFVADKFRDFDYVDMAMSLRDAHPDLSTIVVARSTTDTDLPVDVLDLDELVSDSLNEPCPAPEPAPGDVALFLLSGGTTGLPKLIPRTHDDYLYNAVRCAEVTQLSEHTRYLVALPAGHNFPLACPGILGTLLKGGRVHLIAGASSASTLPVIEQERITTTALVPAVALEWMQSESLKHTDLSSLEVLQVGGSVFAPESARRVKPVLGATLQQAFGMAEGLINLTRLDDPEDAIVNTQGRPISDADEIRVVDIEGHDVASGAIGELWTRGPYTIRGYYNAPEHNIRAFSSDGYYRTGDLVQRRADGNLVVAGRDKDLINRGGEKISAEEIENLILGHNSVYNVAAIAMPDSRLGERVCVYVTLHADRSLTLEQLVTFLEERHIARYKLPEHLVVADTLPITSVGKIDKKALRADITQRLATS